MSEEGERRQLTVLFCDMNDWFAEGFDTKDLKEAKAPLNEIA